MIIKNYLYQIPQSKQQYIIKQHPTMLTKIKNLVCVYKMSIHNYNKSFSPQAITRIHNRILVDEFHYLKEKPLDKIEEIEKVNYQKHAKKWEQLSNKYWDASIKRKDTRLQSPPEIYDNYEYFTKVKWHNEREYNVIQRRVLGQVQKEVVLDIMKVPQLKKHFRTVDLVKTALNPSHTLLFFGCDLNNNQYLKFYIKDLRTNSIFQQKFQGVVKNVVFNDDNSIFYIIEGKDKRAYQLYFKKLGANQSQLIYQQKDPQFHLDFHKSKDGKYIVLVGSSRNVNQIHVIGVNKQHKFQVRNMLSKEKNARGFLNSSDRFYLWTDSNSYDYQIMVFDQQQGGFVPFYTPDQGYTITQVDVFKQYIVLYLRQHSRSIVRIINISNKQVHDIDLKQSICMISPGMNQGYTSNRFNFFISTPFIYNQAYQYDIKNKKLTQFAKFQPTGPKFDKTKYKTSVVMAPSQTGEHIPISIVEKINRKGPSKLLLRVYGFYGLQNEIQYDNVNLTALENDWVIAYAHVRGGNQLGNRWWKSAILQNKSRTWKDLKQCVGYLFAHEYSHPSLLVLHGHSAGAITVWNAINRDPFLYKGAILSYPFLDVLNSLLDQSLPLTNVDHGQFGNPIKEKKYFNSIQSYCPYQTIKTQQYPLLFIQAGKGDYRCPLYQVLKFAQRFRQRAKIPSRTDQVGEKGLIVRIHDEGSHTGVVDVKDQTFNSCELFGYLDYILLQANKDLTYK